MDFLNNLQIGFSVSLTPYNLLYCFIGSLLGTVIGVLPGLGPLATIALLLPLTLSVPPETALIMLAGIYYGAQYGGSTTAILINLPGESSSAVTAIDGYKMARDGRAGAALAAAAIGSFIAGTISTLLIAVVGLPMSYIALKFGAPEYFSLILLGLVLAIALANGSVIKGIAMAVLGIQLGLVGQDIYTGIDRFTLGIIDLKDGVDLVPMALGVFGVSEILRNIESSHTGTVSVNKLTSLWPSRDDIRRSFWPVIRGTAIGSVLGILPGGGAMLSSFASYTVEKKLSKTPQEFGKGAIEGVAGPESANNAGAQTSFLPMLTLGIPSNPIMALMIGAMIMQGITPGPNVATAKPDLFWGLITSMWIGNVMLLVLNLPLVGIWVKLLNVPYAVLAPTIMVFSALGVYGINQSQLAVMTITLFGIAGYILDKLECEPAPLLLGFILGPMLEEHLRRSMLLSRGDPIIFIEHPISLALLVMSFVTLVAMSLPALRKSREEIFVED